MTAESPSTMNFPGPVEAEGLELVGYHDLDGDPAFKLAMQERNDRWFLYVSHFWRSGWSVLDVTDPTSMSVVCSLDGPPQTWTLQVQVADGLLITALEQPNPGWGFDPSQTEKTGILVWDVASDPAEPQLLSHFDLGGRGTHRNHYSGGRYAYLAAQPEGFAGNILVVVDLDDPANPVEAARWWWPGQWVAGGEKPEFMHYLHGPAYVSGDIAYLSYGQVGLIILDVSNPTDPQLVGRFSFGGLGSMLGCHSAVPYGPGVVVVNSEALAESGNESLNYTMTIDVADPTDPKALGWVPVPMPLHNLPYKSYVEKGGRFGPHNQHHHQGQACLLEDHSRVFLTYFNAGLRVYDISEPRNPVETAFFVPEDPTIRRGPKPENALVAQTEDVLVDRRGNIFCSDKNLGLLVLREATASSSSPL